MSDFWEKLDKATREKTTRKELAAKCGVSIATISMWKHRRNFPTADIAVKIAEYLDTTVEYLVTGNERYNPKKDKPVYNDICTDLGVLDDNQLLEIRGVIRHYMQTNFKERDSGKQNLA